MSDPEPVRRRPWNPIASAYHAYSGLLWIAPRTPSVKLGVAILVAVIGLGVLLRLDLIDIAVLVLAGTLLLAVEIVNTAVELLCDRIQPDPDPAIGRIKDVAAAATAMCEIGGGAVLLIVLVPRLLRLLGHA